MFIAYNMRRIWYFILITSQLSQAITLQIDGTIDLGGPQLRTQDDTDGTRNKLTDRKSVKPKMIEIIIQNNSNYGRALSYPTEEATTEKQKIKKPKSRNTTIMDYEYGLAIEPFDRHTVIDNVDNNERHGLKSVKESDSATKVNDDEMTESPAAVVDITRSGVPKDDAKTDEMYKQMFVPKHKVKQVDKIKDFTNHVYEESVKVFDNIKEKIIDYALKKEVEHLKRSYIDKFGDFVRETQDQNVKTRLGHQKVVINTVDTSNRIMERLVSYLMTKVDKKPILRNLDTNRILQNELDKKKDLDNKRLCDELKVCRSKTSFIDFAIGLLDIIISADDNKVKEVTNAATEVLQNTDFSRVMDVHSEKRFHKGLYYLDTYDSVTLRALYTMLKNLLVGRNTPIKLNEKSSVIAVKTLAFLEIIELWDKALPPTEKSLLEWQDLTKGFQDWKDGKRKDISDLVQAFTDHIAKGIASLQPDEKKKFEKKMNIVLGY